MKGLKIRLQSLALEWVVRLSPRRYCPGSNAGRVTQNRQPDTSVAVREPSQLHRKDLCGVRAKS